MTDSNSTTPPKALVVRDRSAGLMDRLVWVVPILAVALSLVFAWRSLSDRGPALTIIAPHGHGIGPGDAIRYLGIEVGEIERVSVREGDGQDGVVLEGRMNRDAADLARTGTMFWIVRPQLSLDAVQGLETIIGAQYVALRPGPPGSQPRSLFSALPTPPLLDELREPHGLEVVLEAPARFGLQPGAAVSYRGVRIGSVTSVGLSSDASSVEVRARIRRAYTQLVRERSVFWETGGVEFGLSLTSGLQLDLDSLRNALIGGISMATPVDAGAAVTGGTRFLLAPDPEDEWLQWAPALPVGTDQLPTGVALPRLLRARLSWTEGRVLRREVTRTGWMVLGPDGLTGPADLLQVPQEARAGTARLEVTGASMDLVALRDSGGIEVLESGLATLDGAGLGSTWAELTPQMVPQGAEVIQRVLLAPEDLLVVREGGRAPMAIDASRLTLEGNGLLVDPGVALTEDWHGGVVMARADGARAGVLLILSEGARIVPLPR